MKVVVRADASSVIGSGHVMRCLTLANALRAAGGSVLFVCRAHDGNLGRLIEQRGHAVALLPQALQDRVPPAEKGYAAWLGASWQEDAAQTRAAITAARLRPDWLIADHYAIDKEWQQELRSLVDHVLVIDDLANRVHECSILLDQNLVANMGERYAGKVPAECRLMLGPQNALLQPEYAQLHRTVAPRRGPVRRIFVFFGGADIDNLTGRTLAAFLGVQRPDVELDVLISSTSPHAAGIDRQVAGMRNVRLHGALPTLAPLMAQADLAIGASGATNWERLCLGLPAIVVSLAENQVPVAACLHEQGLIHWIGHKDTVSETDIAAAIRRVLRMDSLESWSAQCSRVCAGRGTSAVLDAMTAVLAHGGRVATTQ